jgi:hypothetical protein
VALLNSMIRRVAATGRTDSIRGWVAGRQSGRWSDLAVHAAFPKAHRAQSEQPRAATQPAADPARVLRELAELHERGVVTDAEFESLRAGL